MTLNNFAQSDEISFLSYRLVVIPTYYLFIHLSQTLQFSVLSTSLFIYLNYLLTNLLLLKLYYPFI